MGFWHTGYMEFHEPTGELERPWSEPRIVALPCHICGLTFASPADLDLHQFEGHSYSRPLLMLQGRERGRTRLILTSKTTDSDWVIRHAEVVQINGARMSVEDAIRDLSSRRKGVVDVVLRNERATHELQIDFSLADASDLAGVDAALTRFIDAGELSLRSIDDFIMRSKPYRTASKYLNAISDYLFGVLMREGLDPQVSLAAGRNRLAYQGKYDSAVGVLGSFDRPVAEAVCGLVAFHYNQFERAMTRTQSPRVAQVSLRFRALLEAKNCDRSDLSHLLHPGLDVALSDSVMDTVLTWCAAPLDGALDHVDEIRAAVPDMRAEDAFKLHLILAERLAAAREPKAAKGHAEQIRHSGPAEKWYTAFRARLQGA